MSPFASWLYEVGIVAGAIVSIGGLAIAIVKPLRRRVAARRAARLAAVNAEREERERTRDRIEYLWNLWSPNGGATAIDKLNEVHALVTAYAKRLTSIEQRDAMVMTAMGYGIFETGPDGNVVDVSRAALVQSGRVREEMLGRNWFRAVCMTDRDRVLREWLRAVADGREFDERFAWEHRSGRLIPIRMLAWPIAGADPRKPAGWMACTMPVEPVPALWPDRKEAAPT